MNSNSYKIINNSDKLPSYFSRFFGFHEFCFSFNFYVNDYQQKIYEVNIYQLNKLKMYELTNLMLNDFTDNHEVGENNYVAMIKNILRYMYGVIIKEEIIFNKID